jgi:hypothetical protein
MWGLCPDFAGAVTADGQNVPNMPAKGQSTPWPGIVNVLPPRDCGSDAKVSLMGVSDLLHGALSRPVVTKRFRIQDAQPHLTPKATLTNHDPGDCLVRCRAWDIELPGQHRRSHGDVVDGKARQGRDSDSAPVRPIRSRASTQKESFRSDQLWVLNGYWRGARRHPPDQPSSSTTTSRKRLVLSQPRRIQSGAVIPRSVL